MSSDDAGRALPLRGVGLLLVGFVALAMVVVVGRVLQLQVAPSAALSAQMETRVTTRPEPKVRGDLTDRERRVLAATRFGRRLVVDPTIFPEKNFDQIVVRLAQAAGLDAEKLGTRLATTIEQNRQRLTGHASTDGGPVLTLAAGGPAGTAAPASKPRGPVRYLVLSEVLGEEQARAIEALKTELKITGLVLEKVPVREYPTGEHAASILGKVAAEKKWTIGLERLLEGQLEGRPGRISFVRDAVGRPLWMPPGSVQPAEPGQDVRLSIDLEIQRMGYEELFAAVEAQNAAGGRLVIADPSTGEILAMVDIVRDVPDAVPFPWVVVPPKGQRAAPEPDVLATPRRYITIRPDPDRKRHPALGRNRCVEDIYEPGSTFKPFVWATVVELGRAGLDETFDTEGGRWRMPFGRYIEDVTKRGTMTWREVLINSSNIGMIKGAARLSPQELHDAMARFGFGKRTGVGVLGKGFEGEAAGIVTPVDKWTIYTHTSVPYGHEVSVTPVQMVRAFCAFARQGELAGTLPRLRLTAPEPGEGEGVVYRVLPSDVATTTRETMVGVVDTMESNMRLRKEPAPEGGWRYRLFGKSGTAEIPLGGAPKGKRAPRGSKGYFEDQFNSSFIAGGPVEDPRLVVLVIIDDPAKRPGLPRSSRYGSAAAGPVVRRIMERVLTYQGVNPSPRAEPAPGAAR